METKIRVLIADPNEDFRLLMTDILSREGDMKVAGTAADGVDALAKIESLQPDVVLLDLVLPRLDGLGVLRKLAGRKAPPVLVLTEFVNSVVVSSCAELGAAYFLAKPCDTDELLQTLRQCALMANRNGTLSGASGRLTEPRMDGPLENVVTEALHELGVPPHIKGYQYIREAIILTINDINVIDAVTKVLYPEIAKKFSTTSSRVERAIRHATLRAWDNGSAEAQQKYFGRSMAGGGSRPSNSEFIAVVADYIALYRLKQ